MTAIRARLPKYAVDADWGQPASLLFETGPAQSIPVTVDTVRQIAWIAEIDPHLLVVYPNIMEAFLASAAGRTSGSPA